MSEESAEIIGKSEEIMLGTKDVRLSTGDIVHLRPWGIRTSRKIVSNVKTVLAMFRVSQTGQGLGALVQGSYDTIINIVAASSGIAVEELDTDDFLLEDLLRLAAGVIEVNFRERPGGGLGKAIEELMDLTDELFGAPETESETTTATDTPPTKPQQPSEGVSSSS